MTARSDRSDAAARARGDDAPPEDPGLAGLLAARDAEYARAAAERTVADPATPADAGVAGLLAKRDASYHAAATAQQEADATAARLGGIYKTYQVPGMNAEHAAKAAAQQATPVKAVKGRGTMANEGKVEQTGENVTTSAEAASVIAKTSRTPRKSRKGGR